ncbi:FAD monooxygenase%2C PheA/TfdB family [Vibrio cholerae]|nr:FAD monooxygenase%2C PheA/TfdB family [Vibrio cholerae]
MHKHFLMLGQSFVEQLLDKKLLEANAPVWRNTSVDNIELNQAGCLSGLVLAICRERIGSRTLQRR